MCTSVCNWLRREKAPLLAAAGCLALALTYQTFGHGVHSAAMTLCCLPPVLFAVLDALGKALIPDAPPAARRLLGAAAATLTTAMFFQGILEIAGADSPYLRLFYIVGAVEGLAALGLAAMRKGAQV